ncbi:MAG: ribosome biogenesis/translation initiation ATPase RLI [Candidatus Altiarchaeales archaeon]|nr:ribosome biogenesis/translation initiation ATPase RLI [Candidatus Altiarchaeales archaeon]MBD3415676.1 ribosome biogenesis/translation initiation ATPase RLI [Candidatus Altiarchaeales archaeon]
MRIAVHDKDRCKPKDCNFLCIRVCPVNKTGGECIVEDPETKKPLISEALCTGCGICVKRCPYDAIKIINLPEALDDPVHQYGVNGFRLFNLPMPRSGVVGMVGSNGIGKSTALKILSGEIQPNLGGEASWEDVFERFRGHEIHDYLKRLSEGNIRSAYKPQYVEAIPRVVKGKVKDILEKADERDVRDGLAAKLNIENALDKDVKSISGGELQRVALAACLSKDADIYLIDEPSSYLDVRERMNAAKTLRELEDRIVLVVEHDLVVLDYLSDNIHVLFGESGGYGIISNIMGVRVGINEYLGGFLRSENMRFRDEVKFDVRPPTSKDKTMKLLEYPDLKKSYESFELDVEGGEVRKPSILGILGPNATGKTTFVKMLAGAEKPDNTDVELNARISYKPQYIVAGEELVASLKIRGDLVQRFRLAHMMDKRLNELSGGELQRVAVADCLSKDADMYMLDEPSAYLDVEERLALAKYLHGFAYGRGAAVLVVEHDILLIDYLSDELLVFEGESGSSGKTSKPLSMKDGMNMFLEQMDVTFRRDPDTGRPRANKPESVKDREQRGRREYYYTGAG